MNPVNSTLADAHSGKHDILSPALCQIPTTHMLWHGVCGVAKLLNRAHAESRNVFIALWTLPLILQNWSWTLFLERIKPHFRKSNSPHSHISGNCNDIWHVLVMLIVFRGFSAVCSREFMRNAYSSASLCTSLCFNDIFFSAPKLNITISFFPF